MTIPLLKSLKHSIPPAKRPWAVFAVLLALVVIAGLGGRLFRRAGAGSGAMGTAADSATFIVKRGPLVINITEAGTIKAKEQEVIRSEVEGQSTVIFVTAEGSRVNTGDLLVELDASQLQDQLVEQQIRVQNAEAAFIRARENLAVTKNQADSDISKAKLADEFAGEDLDKYNQGEYPAELKKTESQITLANEELQRAVQQQEWSEKLFAEKYISQTELDSDRLARKRTELDYAIAQDSLRLLKDFNHKRQLAQLSSDVEQMRNALERTQRKATADVVQAEADLKAREAEFSQQKTKKEKIENQIRKTKMYAPVEGMVIYATSAQGNWRGNAEPLDVGQTVRERQELIYLPTAKSMVAEIKIHESNLQKLSVGLPARVTVDALPGRVFNGQIIKIAPLPDATSAWLNPDLKVFNTQVQITDDGSAMRSGMTCQAEIIAAQYDDAVYAPVQTVTRIGTQATVYVKRGTAAEPRSVEIGLDNNRMVRIVSGLKPGEEILLSPPLTPGARGTESGVAAPLAQAVPRASKAPAAGADKDGGSPSAAMAKPPAATGAEAEVKDAPAAPGAAPAGSQGRREMTPEAREQMRKRMESMSPEEREKMRAQFRQRRESGGGGAPAP